MKLYKNQIGALNPLVVVLLVVVLGVVGFAGYKVYDNNKSSDSSSSTAPVELSKSEQKAIDEECKKQYNDDDFCKFASNWTMSETFKVVTTTKDADGTTSSTTMEMDGENSSMTSTQDGKETSAVIVLNKTTYYKEYTENVWYKLPQTDDTPTAGGVDTSVVEDLDFDSYKETEDTSTVKSLGKEACGDKTCFKYAIIDPSDTATKETLVWFDDKDYMLARMMITSSDGGTFDSVYTYPDSIKISEPSPVKEAPTFDPSSLGL